MIENSKNKGALSESPDSMINNLDNYLLDSVSTLNEDLKNLIFGTSPVASTEPKSPTEEKMASFLIQEGPPLLKGVLPAAVFEITSRPHHSTAAEEGLFTFNPSASSYEPSSLRFYALKANENAKEAESLKKEKTKLQPFPHSDDKEEGVSMADVLSSAASPNFTSSHMSAAMVIKYKSKSADRTISPKTALTKVDQAKNSPKGEPATPQAKQLNCGYKHGVNYACSIVNKKGFLIATHLVKTAAADLAGLSVGDIFISFGDFSRKNFSGLERLSTYVQSHANSRIPAVVMRSTGKGLEYVCLHLGLDPVPSKDISGKGVLGAVINVWPLQKSSGE